MLLRHFGIAFDDTPVAEILAAEAASATPAEAAAPQPAGKPHAAPAARSQPTPARLPARQQSPARPSPAPTTGARPRGRPRKQPNQLLEAVQRVAANESLLQRAASVQDADRVCLCHSAAQGEMVRLIDLSSHPCKTIVS